MAERTIDKVTHTPGPWSFVEDAGPTPRKVELLRRHWQVGQGPAAGVGKGVALVFGDTEANARLIAAAPQLLEACKLIATERWPDLTLQEQADRLDKAHAAIKLAEGAV